MRTVNRSTRLAARLTPDECAAVEELARKLGKTKTAAVMWAVRLALADNADKGGDTRGEEESAN